MQFVYPGFLLALLAVSIPILIHLFNFKRYKKVYFSNIRFLKNVQEETKSSSRLKHLLILLSRILFISFLVLAFAQPFIPLSEQRNNEQEKTVSIYLDNSFSMNNVGQYGQLFNTGKQYAYQIIKNYPASTKFQILTNENNAKNQRLYSQETALNRLGEISESTNSRGIENSFINQKRTLNQVNSDNREFFIISDFQSNSKSLNLTIDSIDQVHLVPLTGTVGSNLSIDSCWFENPIRKSLIPENLMVRISNHSDQNLTTIPIRLYINGFQKSIKNINISGNSSEVFEFQYSVDQKGIIKGTIELDDHPITFDNKLYFSYSILEKNQILIINSKDTSKALGNLFAEDDNFNSLQISQNKIGGNKVNANNLIVLNGVTEVSEALNNEIQKWVQNGGQLLVFPNENGENKNMNKLLSQMGASVYAPADTNNSRVSTILYDHPLYQSVFENNKKESTLPIIQEYFPLQKGTLPRIEILKTVNGQPFLVEQSYGNGKIYNFSVSTSESQSNLVKHPLFVVTLYQIGINNTSEAKLSYTLGVDEYFELKNSSLTSSLTELKGNETQFIPERRNKGSVIQFWFFDQISKAGHFDLMQDNQILNGFAINYNKSESITSYLQLDELKTFADNHYNVYLHQESFDTIGKTLNDLAFGKQLWQYMLMLALLMILFEILLIKFWRE
ncbi:MAG: BatA domain-containing protein [Salibacteraceae bacterium]